MYSVIQHLILSFSFDFSPCRIREAGVIYPDFLLNKQTSTFAKKKHPVPVIVVWDNDNKCHEMDCEPVVGENYREPKEEV